MKTQSNFQIFVADGFTKAMAMKFLTRIGMLENQTTWMKIALARTLMVHGATQNVKMHMFLFVNFLCEVEMKSSLQF